MAASAGGGACCSGGWTVKIKDTTPVLADGTDFQHRQTAIFVVGSPMKDPPCDADPLDPLVCDPLVEDRVCDPPPCQDTFSMGGFTCMPLWIGDEVVTDDSTDPANPVTTLEPVLNQGCALHTTLGASLGVGYCKVRGIHQSATSGCDDPADGTGCGHFYWDFCEVENGLAFQAVTPTTADPRLPVFDNIMGGEFRYFLFTAFSGAPYTLFAESAGLSDSVMFLYDTDGVTEIAYNDDFNGLMSSISW